MSLLLFVLACTTDPEAPPEVAFDHVACDHCAMLVSEPAYAAVLDERNGKRHVFDDPGCLLRFVLEDHPAVARMWFHDGEEWRRESNVAFTTGNRSPMDSGLRAVPPGTAGALTLGAASAQLLGGAP
ncbi:MAG: hypothetical protein Q8P41_08345 [Pseudomonadota bacterium]|nr:hypothetical protein [Pseudomonadota bacterium]